MLQPETRRRSQGLLDLLVVGELVVVVVVVDDDDRVVVCLGVVLDDPEKINCSGGDTFQIGLSLVATGLEVVVDVAELVPVDSALRGT